MWQILFYFRKQLEFLYSVTSPTAKIRKTSKTKFGGFGSVFFRLIGAKLMARLGYFTSKQNQLNTRDFFKFQGKCNIVRIPLSHKLLILQT